MESFDKEEKEFLSVEIAYIIKDAQNSINIYGNSKHVPDWHHGYKKKKIGNQILKKIGVLR